MLILKSRSLSSRWYKATSCSLARSSSDRLWIGTGCNRTLWPNMVAHVWSPCREEERWVRVDVTPFGLYPFVASFSRFLWTCPLRETKEPNKLIRIRWSSSYAFDEELQQPQVNKNQTNSSPPRSISPELQLSHKNVLFIYNRAQWLFESRAADPPPQTLTVRSEELFKPSE